MEEDDRDSFLERTTPEAILELMKLDGTFDKLRKMICVQLEETGAAERLREKTRQILEGGVLASTVARVGGFNNKAATRGELEKLLKEIDGQNIPSEITREVDNALSQLKDPINEKVTKAVADLRGADQTRRTAVSLPVADDKPNTPNDVPKPTPNITNVREADAPHFNPIRPSQSKPVPPKSIASFVANKPSTTSSRSDPTPAQPNTTQSDMPTKKVEDTVSHRASAAPSFEQVKGMPNQEKVAEKELLKKSSTSSSSSSSDNSSSESDSLSDLSSLSDSSDDSSESTSSNSSDGSDSETSNTTISKRSKKRPLEEGSKRRKQDGKTAEDTNGKRKRAVRGTTRETNGNKRRPGRKRKLAEIKAEGETEKETKGQRGIGKKRARTKTERDHDELWCEKQQRHTRTHDSAENGVLKEAKVERGGTLVNCKNGLPDSKGVKEDENRMEGEMTESKEIKEDQGEEPAGRKTLRSSLSSRRKKKKIGSGTRTLQAHTDEP